eukprot:g1130.t1
MLAERSAAVALEICPLSNRMLRYCEEGLQAHPIKQLVEAGVACSINADDPAFFRAPTSHGLLREYEACRDIVGLSDEQLAACAATSIRSSTAPQARKVELLAEIDAWLGRGSGAAGESKAGATGAAVATGGGIKSEGGEELHEEPQARPQARKHKEGQGADSSSPQVPGGFTTGYAAGLVTAAVVFSLFKIFKL